MVPGRAVSGLSVYSSYYAVSTLPSQPRVLLSCTCRHDLRAALDRRPRGGRRLAGVARCGTPRRLARDRHHRPLSGRRPAGGLAGAGARRLRRSGGGGRPRLRARLAGRPGIPHAGRHRAGAGARRADRRAALEPRVGHVLPDADGDLRHRAARHADGGWRPRLRPGGDRTPVVPRRRLGARDLAQGLRGRIRHERADLGGHQRAAGRRRTPDHDCRRRAGRAGRGVRQAHRRRAVAVAGGDGRDGLRPAGHLRGGRRPPAHHLAPRSARLARPGQRRGVLGAAVGRPLGAERRHAGQERRLPVRQPVLRGLVDDAPRQRPSRRGHALEGEQPQRAAERHRGAARPAHHAAHPRRLRVRRRQLRGAARAERPDGRAALDEQRDDGTEPLGHGVPRAAGRALLRQRRRGGSDHRAVHAGGATWSSTGHI